EVNGKTIYDKFTTALGSDAPSHRTVRRWIQPLREEQKMTALSVTIL
ncbi:unnamed protein product, partial [Rotaria magnacalcarata]